MQSDQLEQLRRSEIYKMLASTLADASLSERLRASLCSEQDVLAECLVRIQCSINIGLDAWHTIAFAMIMGRIMERFDNERLSNTLDIPSPPDDFVRDSRTGVRYMHMLPHLIAPKCMMEFHYKWYNGDTGNSGMAGIYCDTRADFEKLVASWNENLPDQWEYTIL